MIELQAISLEPKQNHRFGHIPECAEILTFFDHYFVEIGYTPPWIGYFIKLGQDIVGTGAFKGRPRDGKVEIAYAVFKNWEGKGIGTKICAELVLLSLKTNENIIISARTLPEESASCSILRKNNFTLGG